MKKLIYLLSLFFSLLSVLLVFCYLNNKTNLNYTLMLTSLTTTYHFLMRLIVGYSVSKKSKINVNSKWFRTRPFEKKLYRFLKVKKWKKYAPTFNKDSFRVEKSNLEKLRMNLCISEVVHEVIVLLSFLPVIFGLFIDSILPFFITSLIASLFDLGFVVIQRFNHERLERLMKRF